MISSIVQLTKTWRGRFILAIVASQLAIPLHYYVRHRDPHDERFAWRMFSPMRMSKCQATWQRDDQPLNLGGEFHEAWLELVERGRFTVIEAMGAELCKRYPGARIRVSLDCTYLDAPAEHYGGYDLCQVPEL
ncbi:MAG: hypothetical protein NT062_23150 [Proteobacteria bacterium]|nr:hypothetical protein [Pseudomonadota bacterium]